jgi:hypothetical protein
MRNSWNTSVDKPKGNRLFWRPGSGWEGNVKLDLKNTERGDVEWIRLIQGRVQ